ncbi:MAG: PilW family protein [Gammaproteobacteria bacterium]|nr:PilW family protein [Gammaproteobacteria bacterium]
MKRQCGFSMVELMVAITLALVLTGAVISVFIGSRTAYQATAGVGDMADSGRFALNIIGDSVRSAGNIACNSANSGTNVQLPAANNGFTTNFPVGISGFEANGSAPGATVALPQAVGAAGNWTAALDGSITAATAGAFGVPVQGSDVLVVYSSKRSVPPVYTTADVLGGVTVVPVSAPVPPAGSIAANDYAAISDCTKSMISRATAVAANSVTLADALTLGFAAGAFVTPLTTTVYYIGTGSDGDSSLWRLEQINGAFPAPGPQSPEELVPDVENMQVLYGIDPAGTGTASAYVTANNIGGFNVVSIQIALLVASPPQNKPVAAPPAFNLVGTLLTVPGDNRARQVFYATINLRNASS